MTKTVVLAYSGGLDTSVAVRWMIQEWGVDVVTVACDVGQGGDFDAICDRARAAGAVEAVVADARAEFADDFVVPALRANALYEGKYPLVSALSRPVIVRHLVEAARTHGATAVAHGCTGKGNDQVRFEVGIRALAPDLEVLAPVRVWGMTREDCIEYAATHAIPITSSKDKLYSIDDNLWGRAIECGEMEDPWAEPPAGVWSLTVPTATEPTEVTIAFERGVPVALDGTPMAMHDLVAAMNTLVGSYGWGRLDMVENRRVGIKSRETYEAPGALALIQAHQDLESLTVERDLQHEKQRLEGRYADLVYDGQWFSPLKRSLDAFIEDTQKHVNGEIRLELHGGRATVQGRRSSSSLYDFNLATYDEGDAFDQASARGFIDIFGLSSKVATERDERVAANEAK